MSIKAVLFDLDGTLLPMDLDEFFKVYFKLLATRLAPYGYTDPKKLVGAIMSGVDGMIENDGKKTNEEVFWDRMTAVYGEGIFAHRTELDGFYLEEFDRLKEICGYTPDADRAIKAIKDKGLKTVVATKPIFPDTAIRKRMEWAGVAISDFEFYTTYESCSYCKPNPMYYKTIADDLGLLPEECLMVGNDVTEDMPASEAGMKVFLLTDCLINRNNDDISKYQNGGFKELLEYVDTLI